MYKITHNLNCHPHFWLSNPTCKTLSTLSPVVLQADNCYDWLLQFFILSKSCILLEQSLTRNCGLLHIGAVQPSSLQYWSRLTMYKITILLLLNLTCILACFIFSRCILVTSPFFVFSLLILHLDAHVSPQGR